MIQIVPDNSYDQHERPVFLLRSSAKLFALAATLTLRANAAVNQDFRCGLP